MFYLPVFIYRNRYSECDYYSYVIYWERGYQVKDSAISATTTKLKGIALTNCTELNISTIHGGVDGNRIWDVADYVMPPQVILVLGSTHSLLGMNDRNTVLS